MNNFYEIGNENISCNFLQGDEVKLPAPLGRGFHCHWGVELLYIHDGNGHFIVDKTTYPYHPNTLVVFKPFQLHGIFPDPGNPVYVRTVIVFNPEILTEKSASFPHLQKYIRQLAGGVFASHVFYEESGFLNELYRLMKKQYGFSMEYEDGERTLLFVQAVLGYLYDNKQVFFDQEAAAPRIHTNPYVAHVLEWVENHYDQPYSLETLAESLNTSKYHLAHLFKTNTGISIGEFVLQCRIREAKMLLSSTGLAISVVADKTGFPTVSSFCSMFKEKTGDTPGLYRRNAKERNNSG